MIKKNNVIAQVQNIIKNQSGISVNEQDILLDKGINSISMINIIIGIESEFNIEFEPVDLNYKSLRSVDCISEKIIEQIKKAR